VERLLFITLLGIAAVALADGPGSRLLTTPEPPRPAASPALDRDMQRCEEMNGAQKERCLRALRSATSGAARAPHEGPSPARPGPEATGAGSNAGSGASSGTSGASGANSAVGGAR
jgi:hypothetical protein